MTILDQFNNLKRKSIKKEVQNKLLLLLTQTSPEAKSALSHLKTLDKVADIYFKQNSVAIYGTIDGIYYYKEFTET